MLIIRKKAEKILSRRRFSPRESSSLRHHPPHEPSSQIYWGLNACLLPANNAVLVFLDLVQKTVQEYRERGMPFTIRSLCRELHLAPVNLRTYPSIKSLFEEVARELREEHALQRQHLEDELLDAPPLHAILPPPGRIA